MTETRIRGPLFGGIAALCLLLQVAGCAINPSPEPAASTRPEKTAAVDAAAAPAAVTAPPSVAVPPPAPVGRTAPAITVPAPLPADPVVTPAPQPSAVPAPPPKVNAESRDTPPSKPVAPPPAKIAAPAPARPPQPPAPPPMALATLEQRLKDTDAIGVFTKIALKNQVDDLLNRAKALHQGSGGASLAQLRQSYDQLLSKVHGLLKDGDPALANAIMNSRESLWSVLTDPVKFAKI